MNIIGIIVEYNPFHNGHLYQINKIKELYPNSLIIAAMSGNFNQRGEVSIIDKWNKTKTALESGIDIVIEIPYVFATQAADIFAKGGISLLNEMKIDTLVFGSESNDINLIKKIADVQVNDWHYNDLIKKYMDLGFNYPTSISKSLFDIIKIKIEEPNDILGICYCKEIINSKYSINPICIKRTNNYHDLELSNTITSASSIRKALKEKKDVIKYVPNITDIHLHKQLFFNENYFKFLKYKIISERDLNIFHTVDEGIDYRIKKYIESATSLDDLIQKIKTKRYTYNKISRMLTHILNNFTKIEAKNLKDIEYIRVLGFSNNGQKYLNKIKKDINIPLITNFSSIKSNMLNIEKRTTDVYASILNEEDKIKLMESEYKNKPIKKD